MPELPDVEVFKGYFEATALHSRIEKVEVLDSSLLHNGDEKRLKEATVGQTFRGARRHGKFLFGELPNQRAVRFHFGMTGFLRCYEDPKDAPGHVRVVFALRNGHNIAFDCQRKFGHVGIISNIDAFLSEKQLGPDALKIDFARFSAVLAGAKRPVKASLMNQSRLAGLGNVYSDEILFQARVHPESAPKEWRKPALEKLYHAMQEVLQTAIESGADPERMPQKWLTPHRGKQSCPNCGGKLQKKKVAGRSSWFCPDCQQMI